MITGAVQKAGYYQKRIAVGLVPSRREGFGLVCTEALASCAPVLARNVGGLKLQVKNGYNGWLFDTLEEGTDRLVNMLKNEDATFEMGAKGREFVLQKFTTLRSLINILQLASQIILRNNTKPPKEEAKPVKQPVVLKLVQAAIEA